MGRRLALLGLLTLLAAPAVAPAASASPVEGVVQAGAPATVDGNLEMSPTQGTLWVTNEDGGQLIRPMVLHASQVQVTHKVLEIDSVHADTVNVSLESPQSQTQSETFTVENATVVVSALGHRTDIVFGPTDEREYVARAQGQGTGLIGAESDGIEVIDGYRERNNIRGDQENENEFSYRYQIQEPLVSTENSPTVELAGPAQGYVWDAHVLIRNDTDTIASYETGAEIRSSNQGTTKEEHYEYVTFRFEELNATLQPRGVRDRLLSSHADLDVDGSVALRNPSGTLATTDGQYRTDGLQSLTMDGNVSLSVSPSGQGNGPPMSVGIDGDVSSITAPLLPQGESIVSTESVVAGAGGATLIGLAVWYMASAKGASMAIPLVASRRSEEEDREKETRPDEPSELLFDPDRFTLYHLIRSRVGLSADEARDLTGIDKAGEQLDLLAEHGLLEILSEDPRRYCMPGSVNPGTAEQIAFLRDPAAQRVGELLAVHGLIPEDQLAERVRRTETAAAAARVPDLVQSFVERGLAYREAGEDGYVVDPTDRLFDCFDRMGIGAVPKVS